MDSSLVDIAFMFLFTKKVRFIFGIMGYSYVIAEKMQMQKQPESELMAMNAIKTWF